MFTELSAENYKSWRRTGIVRLAPLTALLGTNSSGKSSLLKLFLLFKQTVESQDRKRVLEFGDYESYADFGAYYDVALGHDIKAKIGFSLSWIPDDPLKLPIGRRGSDVSVELLKYKLSVEETDGVTQVAFFQYAFDRQSFGMRCESPGRYQLDAGVFHTKRRRGRAWPLPAPTKCYGFPSEAVAYYTNTAFLPDLALAFEREFQDITYLGPLREEPARIYTWAGDRPSNVGVSGQYTVPVLLAAAAEKMLVGRPGRGKRRRTLIAEIEHWLQAMGLAHTLTLKPLGRYRKEYEFVVQMSASGTPVNIADVGFGVSQVLPVLVACFYAPERSVLLLEQPEIHLHPRAQSVLADVLINAVKEKRIQLIIETHSEHLIRRIQRRMAEELLVPDETALYFCRRDDGTSQIEELEMDMYGYIRNWPDNFFGDDFGDVKAMQEKVAERRGFLSDRG